MQLESLESFEQCNIIIKQEVCIKQPHSLKGMHNPLDYRWTIIYSTTLLLIDGWVASNPALLQREQQRISLRTCLLELLWDQVQKLKTI